MTSCSKNNERKHEKKTQNFSSYCVTPYELSKNPSIYTQLKNFHPTLHEVNSTRPKFLENLYNFTRIDSIKELSIVDALVDSTLDFSCNSLLKVLHFNRSSINAGIQWKTDSVILEFENTTFRDLKVLESILSVRKGKLRYLSLSYCTYNEDTLKFKVLPPSVLFVEIETKDTLVLDVSDVKELPCQIDIVGPVFIIDDKAR